MNSFINGRLQRKMRKFAKNPISGSRVSHSSDMPIYCCFMWCTTIWIYFMTLIIQYMHIIQGKLTTFHRFQIILISTFKWIEKFYNFICFIINHDFYIITFWTHCRLFLIIYGRKKLFAIANWIFHVTFF